MNYLSVCSGIESATVAWHPLGWTPLAFSEIERFPCEVLAHHYPNIPNLGDMTNYEEWKFDRPVDLIVGGTPCQSFSVAGLRKGISDPRGNLALVFLGIINRFRPRWVVWENVPGVLSSLSHDAPDLCPPQNPVDLECEVQEVEVEDDYGSEEIHAFHCLLAGFSELGYGTSYRVLDAQYFGVAQRRRRVFVVGHLGDWRCAAAVLFERHSLQGNPSPRKEAGKNIAPTISARPSGVGGLGTDFDLDGGLIAGTLRVRAGGGCGPEGPDAAYANQLVASRVSSKRAKADGGPSGDEDQKLVVPSLDASFGRLQGCSGQDANHGHGHLVVAPVTTRAYSDRGTDENHLIGHTLTGSGYDASEDGTGRGTPIVSHPIPLDLRNACRGEKALDSGGGIGNEGDPAFSVTKTTQGLAFDCKAAGNTGFSIRDLPGSLRGAGHGGGHAAIQHASEVRRLTPRECERLQGFPDDYTWIPRNGRCPDGPRYKSLGNSKAVPVIQWIGKRIALVDSLIPSSAK